MAPQSAFEYNIDTNNFALKNGNYTYHTKLVSGNKHFELSKDFVINVTTREKIKKKIISEKKIPVYWFIIIIMCLIGLLLLMYLLLKRRGRNKNEKV